MALTPLKLVRMQKGIRQWELAKNAGIPERN